MPELNAAVWFGWWSGVALKSALVLGVAWMGAQLLRRRSAAARHLIWTAAAAAVLALPLLTLSVPAVGVPGAELLLPANADFRTTVTERQARAVPRHDAPAAGSAGPAGVSRSLDWRLALLLAWALGSAVFYGQMLAALMKVRRMRRPAQPFGDGELYEAAVRELEIRSGVEVLELAPGTMPMTIGLLRPIVFVPADHVAWTAEQRRMVLLHELAHVRRGDVATQLLARMALGLYWWNPLAWRAWKEFLKEREQATDDVVLRAGTRASSYATYLLEAASTLEPAGGWAALAMARRSELEGRLMSILNSGANRTTVGRVQVALAAVLALALTIPLAALGPQEAQGLPPDIDAAIRAAAAERNSKPLEDAAKVAELLMKNDVARKLLESSVAIRAAKSGEQSVEYGVGLLNLAEFEKRRGGLAAAEPLYRKAVQTLGERPEAARGHVGLGVLAINKKELAGAYDHFQQAQRAAPGEAGLALMWMAVAKQRDGDKQAAERFYEKAVKAQEANSQDWAVAGRMYANFLKQCGRMEDAMMVESRMLKARVGLHTPVRTPTEKRPGVHAIGGGVMAPVPVFKLEPEYSEEARAAQLAGTVMLRVDIDPQGVARNIQVVRSLGLGLDEKAVEAINQWRFKPAMKDGEPVTVAANIEVNFRLQ